MELDKTYHVQTLPGGAADPTTFDPTWDQLNDGHPGGETLSVGFHQSYMPVLAKGCVGDAAWKTAAACSEVAFADPDLTVTNHCYLSVVPRSGCSIGGVVDCPLCPPGGEPELHGVGGGGRRRGAYFQLRVTADGGLRATRSAAVQVNDAGAPAGDGGGAGGGSGGECFISALR